MKRRSRYVVTGAVCSALAAFSLLCGCSDPAKPNGTPPAGKPEPEVIAEMGKFAVDAKLDDWTDEDKANGIFIPVAEGQSVNIYAKKVADEGVIIALDVKHHRYVDSSPNMFTNSNFRFSFSNGGEERYFTFAGDSKGISGYKTVSSSDGQIRSTQMECYVKKDLVENFDGDIRFGFRLHMSGCAEDYFWGYSGDWRFDGCDVGECSYFITENGITGALPGEPEVDIDGEEDDRWGSIQPVNSAYNENGVMSVRGFKGADGAYFYFEAVHKENNAHQYWCFNPNFEFRLGKSATQFKTFKAVRYSDSTVLYSSGIGKAAMVTRFDDEASMYYTAIELFVPYEQIGIAAEDKLIVGIAFRADERSVTPWVPVMYEGEATWDMHSLAVAANGWERAR